MEVVFLKRKGLILQLDPGVIIFQDRQKERKERCIEFAQREDGIYRLRPNNNNNHEQIFYTKKKMQV